MMFFSMGMNSAWYDVIDGDGGMKDEKMSV